jgi:hypothetical protein
MNVPAPPIALNALIFFFLPLLDFFFPLCFLPPLSFSFRLVWNQLQRGVVRPSNVSKKCSQLIFIDSSKLVVIFIYSNLDSIIGISGTIPTEIGMLSMLDTL